MFFLTARISHLPYLTRQMHMLLKACTKQGTKIPTGQVLWEELLEGVILPITPSCYLLHMLLKDKCMCLQDE